jgi:hypothetical protein
MSFPPQYPPVNKSREPAKATTKEQLTTVVDNPPCVFPNRLHQVCEIFTHFRTSCIDFFLVLFLDHGQQVGTGRGKRSNCVAEIAASGGGRRRLAVGHEEDRIGNDGSSSRMSIRTASRRS